jgi:predicted acylesterase/phospholipase RssA
MGNYNAWVLSGGGAKGCFQAGSIYYLGTKNLEFKPDVIAGCSVGALNSLLPAQEWEWPLPNIADLVDIWLQLNDESDMYEMSDEAKEFDDDRFNNILTNAVGLGLTQISDFFLGDSYGPEKSEYGNYEIDFYKEARIAQANTGSQRRRSRTSLAGRVTSILIPGHAISTIIIGQSAAQISDAIDDFAKIQSLFTLKPIEALIRSKLDYEKFSRTWTKLKLVSTSINNGKLCYMDENTRFHVLDYKPEETTQYESKTIFSTEVRLLEANISGVDRLIKGALASAAIPGAFPPQLLGGNICFDGGITDTLPLRSIQPELKAIADTDRECRIIMIRCNPKHNNDVSKRELIQEIPRGRPSDINRPYFHFHSQDEADNMGMLSYIGGLVSSMRKEINRTDDLELQQHLESTTVYDIAPTFNINGTAQINPGLIRIQLAYGWMRAFDIIEGDMDSLKLTDKIILSRLHAWRLEELSVNLIAFPNRAFVPHAIPKIRQMKVLVKKYTDDRIARFGRESVPRNADKHFAYDDKWFNSFEKHKWQSNRTPWDKWIDMDGTPIVEDSPPW